MNHPKSMFQLSGVHYKPQALEPTQQDASVLRSRAIAGCVRQGTTRLGQESAPCSEGSLGFYGSCCSKSRLRTIYDVPQHPILGGTLGDIEIAPMVPIELPIHKYF